VNAVLVHEGIDIKRDPKDILVLPIEPKVGITDKICD